MKGLQRDCLPTTVCHTNFKNASWERLVIRFSERANMAEEQVGNPTIVNQYHIDRMIVQGDHVGTKQGVQAHEIGRVVQTAAGENQNTGDLEADVGAMNLNQVEADEAATLSTTRPLKSDEARKKPSKSAQDVKSQFLLEKATVHLSKSEYAAAAKLLDDPCVLESDHFLAKLLLTECYMHLGISHRAKQMIDAVRQIVTSSGLEPSQLKTYANEFSSTRALILLRIASDLFQASGSSPDDLVNELNSCMRKISDCTEQMIEVGDPSRKIGVEYGVQYMIEIHNHLENVTNGNPEKKAKNGAWSLNEIGYNLTLAGEHEKSIKYRKIGVETLERRFGSNASKYKIYGYLLHNLGLNHSNVNKFSEAEAFFVKAIEAKEKATNFKDESEKIKSVEKSKTELGKV